MRLDYVQHEVDKERRMVHCEDEIARTKHKILQFNGKHARNQEIEILTDEKIERLLRIYNKL